MVDHRIFWYRTYLETNPCRHWGHDAPTVHLLRYRDLCSRLPVVMAVAGVGKLRSSNVVFVASVFGQIDP